MAVYEFKETNSLNCVMHAVVTAPNPIAYPDGTETGVSNPIELSQLDGEGMRDMGEQHARHMNEVGQAFALRILASNRGVHMPI